MIVSRMPHFNDIEYASTIPINAPHTVATSFLSLLYSCPPSNLSFVAPAVGVLLEEYVFPLSHSPLSRCFSQYSVGLSQRVGYPFSYTSPITSLMVCILTCLSSPLMKITRYASLSRPSSLPLFSLPSSLPFSPSLSLPLSRPSSPLPLPFPPLPSSPPPPSPPLPLPLPPFPPLPCYLRFV